MNTERFEHLCEIIANKEENPSLTQVGKRELLKCARAFAENARHNYFRAKKLRRMLTWACVVLVIETVLLALNALGVI